MGIIFGTGMPKVNQPKQRFASAEIVRAIEDVRSAGLTIYAVEITLAGSIKITTQPERVATKRPAKTDQATQTDPADEAAPVKNQA